MDAPQREPSFSLNEFRYWLNKNKDDKKVDRKSKAKKIDHDDKNIKVESRLGVTRLGKKILEHNSELGEEKANAIAETFKLDGATIISVEDLMAVVSVGETTFNLPKMYTKKSGK